MEVVDDARLMELVREPARDLLPAAHRASVVRPLIVLLSFLPGLLGFWNRPPDEATCRQGLLGLDVAAGKNPMNWIVTASRGPVDHAVPAFPLATLSTAAALRIELISPESRLLLVSYLSSAFLLLSLGGLAKSVGGQRFALLVVCLACGNREFLRLSESLPPVALPLAFAALSFRALLVHQTTPGALVSWSSVASGLALAACWLAGGELALASWFILLMASLLFVVSPTQRQTRRTLVLRIRQRLSDLMSAMMNLFVLTSIAITVVAGWQTAVLEEISLPSLTEGWAWLRRDWFVESRSTQVVLELFQAVGCWLGFSVLGVLQLIRERATHRVCANTKGAWFLIGWCCVAWMCFWMKWPDTQDDLTNSMTGTALPLLPLLFLAAWGLDAVLRREFGLGAVLTATVVTLGVVSAPRWIVRLPGSVTGEWFATLVLTGAIVFWFGRLLVRAVLGSEHLSRKVISSCVILLVLADVTNGFTSRRRIADDERELLAFRRQLIMAKPPDVCWLMTDQAVPARLQFFLRNLRCRTFVLGARDPETLLY